MSPDRPYLDACTYCGLPLPRSWRTQRTRPASGGKVYCCVGCRFAAAVTDARGAEGHNRWMLARLGTAIFFTMNVMVFTMALWSQELYAEQLSAPDRLAGSLWGLFRYLALLFSLPVLFLLGGPIVENVCSTLRRGNVTTDLLVLLGVAAAYTYSVISVVRETGHVYFEVACMVLVFVTLGRWLEARGRLKAGEVLDSLARLLPETARVLRAGTVRLVPRQQVQVGDRLRVLPGERLPADGRIVEGRTDIDQQLLTGESVPVSKALGQRVYSGTLNLTGDIVLQVTSAAGAETVSRMMQLIRKSRYVAGPYQRIADRVAACLVPAVFLLAALTCVYHAHYDGTDAGILSSLSVVLIACPCALGLATPVAIWAALGRSARGQVLFRSGAALERLAGIRGLRFDKTGTLTRGQATVEHLFTDGQTDRGEILAAAAAVCSVSGHPFSTAIARFTTHDDPARECANVETVPGCGLAASVTAGSERVYVGSRLWMSDVGQRFNTLLSRAASDAETAGCPIVCIAWGGRVRGVFLLGECLRPESADAIDQCRNLGMDVAVLTGDHPGRAGRIAAILDLVAVGGQTPEKKVAAIRTARHQHGAVAMVGDGINDAAAMAASDVGIAMGCGADLSRDAADVCLLSDDLARLPWVVALSRRTLRVIRQNLFWAFVYNTAGIGLAVTGRLNPVWSALAMAISSLLVVGNSLRLSRFPEPALVPAIAQNDLAAGDKIGTEINQEDRTSEQVTEAAALCSS